MATTQVYFKKDFDSAQPWAADTPFTIKDIFRFTPTQATAVDIDGAALEQNQEYWGFYPTDQTSGTSLILAEIAKIRNLGKVKTTSESAQGLRGEPVADATELTALPNPREYEKRQTKDNGKQYVFKLTADLTTEEDADVLNLGAGTGKWIEQNTPQTQIGALVGGFIYSQSEDPDNHVFEMNGQTITDGVAKYPVLAGKWSSWVSGADIVLPDWRGRAMMATGGLGITGAVGATYADATSVNGLRTTLRTRSTAGGNAFNETVAAFTNTANLNQQGSVINQMSGDAETRPNAVGLVLCVIAGELAVGEQAVDHISRTNGDGSAGTTDTYTLWGDAGETISLGTYDVPIPTVATPTSFVSLGDWNGVNLQNAVTNGMLIGLGTGAAGTGAPSGAFTGSCKITVIGDWIQQDFLTANAPGTVVGERFSRQSFNGGTTWTSWFGQ